MTTRILLLLVALGITTNVPKVEAVTFVAYSMKEAERRIEAGIQPSTELLQMGGITDLVGMVHDREHGDCIIVGMCVDRKQPLAIDDLVVAMRALMIHGTHPLVSIDATPETDQTGMQVVRFEGGIENTRLGQAMLEADVHLKKLALGTLSAEIWGVRSYLSRLVEQTREAKTRNRVVSRFWVSNPKPSLAIRQQDGVFAIMRLNATIQTEVLYGEMDGQPVEDITELQDQCGNAFARQMTEAFDDLATQYPIFYKIEPILAMVSLAAGMAQLDAAPDLSFWLEDYEVPEVTTPKQLKLIQSRQQIDTRSLEWVLTGGIRANPIVVKLKRGYPSAFKQVVLQSRPSLRKLVWHPPLTGWPIPGADDIEIGRDKAQSASSDNPSFTVDAILRQTDGESPSNPLRLSSSMLPPLRAAMPEILAHDHIHSPETSPNIGGVMLSGAATVDGADEAEVDLAGGNFSLVVDGENARIAPDAYRKFITALWCVYYCDQDPGISIDPIGKESEKHLVRYIGRVINTDLGRVMREADYIMKKWAVGTEQPDYPGFKPVDGWMAEFGAVKSGVSRRFWFVPEDLQFKRGGDLLLFGSGRIRLNTEYDVDGLRGRASKADEQFAGFFTEHYNKIAEKHPVFKELFEYAKMVALAKYLKEQRVPLHWFLLANKDLVITEDSPGTVDQLAKGSEYFRGMTIMGGVDLNPNSQYVYDEQAVSAIRDAMLRMPSLPVHTTGLATGTRTVHPAPGRFSFDVGQQSYSVLPQHTLTSGKDHRGIRYQTDLALRSDGTPGLELVRYFNAKRRDEGQFGRGWHLLIPYQVKPADNATREFLNVVIPERMVVENLCTGDRETLTFSEDKYAAAGYVPDKVESSQVVGLFLMSNMSYRLADKLGNQFHFDPGGRLTDMFLSHDPDHHVAIRYVEEFTDRFDRMPYTLQSTGGKRVRFLSVLVPEKITVADPRHDFEEVLVFRERSRLGIPGYVPMDEKTSRFRIAALMSDGGLDIHDQRGNIARFDSDWEFESMLPSPDDRMPQSIAMGGQTARFRYTTDNAGQVVIASASLVGDRGSDVPSYIVDYRYGPDGRLARVERSREPLASARPQTRMPLALVGR